MKTLFVLVLLILRPDGTYESYNSSKVIDRKETCLAEATSVYEELSVNTDNVVFSFCAEIQDTRSL